MTGWGDPDAYEVSFGPLCAQTVPALLAALGTPRPGQRLLDVGTGTGVVAAAASRAGWTVDAVDADPAMVAAASARHPWVDVRRGALPDLPCAEGTYDAVAANFVVNHTDDPRAAVAELVRVCRVGGRVGLTIWPERLISVNQLWNDVMVAAGVEPPPRKALPDEQDFDRSAGGLAALAAQGGLDNAAASEVDVVLSVSPADLWLAAEGGIATIGAVYLGQSPAGRAKMREAYDALTQTMAVDGVLTLPGTALLAAGVRNIARD